MVGPVGGRLPTAAPRTTGSEIQDAHGQSPAAPLQRLFLCVCPRHGPHWGPTAAKAAHPRCRKLTLLRRLATHEALATIRGGASRKNGCKEQRRTLGYTKNKKRGTGARVRLTSGQLPPVPPSFGVCSSHQSSSRRARTAPPTLGAEPRRRACSGAPIRMCGTARRRVPLSPPLLDWQPRLPLLHTPHSLLVARPRAHPLIYRSLHCDLHQWGWPPWAPRQASSPRAAPSNGAPRRADDRHPLFKKTDRGKRVTLPSDAHWTGGESHAESKCQCNAED